MRHFLVPGLVAGTLMFFAMMIAGMAFAAAIPAAASEYQNEAIFRSWNDPLMYYFYIHPFVWGVLLSFVWSRTSALFEGKNRIAMGAKFGLCIWGFFGVPGMLMSLSSFQVSLILVASWTASLLIQDLVAGMVFALTTKVS